MRDNQHELASDAYGSLAAVRGIRRSTRTWSIPHHHRECAGPCLELPPPRRWSITHIAVEEHHRRSNTDALIGEAQTVKLHQLHRSPDSAVARRSTRSTDCLHYTSSC